MLIAFSLAGVCFTIMMFGLLRHVMDPEDPKEKPKRNKPGEPPKKVRRSKRFKQQDDQ